MLSRLTSAATPESGTDPLLLHQFVVGLRNTGHRCSGDRNAVCRRTDARNITTTYSYDALDRLTHLYGPLVNGNGGWKEVEYTSTTQQDIFTGLNATSPATSCNPASNPPDCRHDQVALDGLGRPTQKVLVSDPGGADHVQTSYDTSGRVHYVSNPYRSGSAGDTYAYDGLNRVTCVTHADSNSASVAYGASVGGAGVNAWQRCPSGTHGLGYPALFTDEAGKKRETWTDALGRTIEVDEPDSSGSLNWNTCYSYNLTDDLVRVTQGSQVGTYAYDGLSRLTSPTTPESGTTNFYYTTSRGGLCSGDPSAVCRRTDARSITTTYSYDAVNRLT